MKNIFILGIMVLLLLGCVRPDIPQENLSEPVIPEEQPVSPADEPIVQPEPEEPVPEIEIPPGTLIMFFTEGLGSQSEYLGHWDVGESYRVPVGLPLGDIEWDTSSYAIVGYMPELDQKYVLYTFTSPSYASNFAYPRTEGNKLFIVREWGDPGERTIQDIIEIDPVTGETISTTRLSPSPTNFAIADDRIFYGSEITTDLWGDRSGGGHLYVKDFGAGQSQKLLDYHDESNTGGLYGVGNTLLSVKWNDVTESLDVREHSTITGEITRTIHSIQTNYVFIDTKIYGGENALYLRGKISESPEIFQIYALNLDGSEPGLLEIELNPDQSAIYLDEENGKLVISFIKGGKFSSVITYDLDTGNSEELVLTKQAGLKTGHRGNQYLFLD